MSKSLLQKEKKISKNNVSYFESGIKFGLRFCGFTRQEIQDMFNKDLDFANKVKEIMRAYDTKEFVEDAEKEMFDLIEIEF